MIVVRVELWPMGSGHGRQTIAQARIENRGRAGDGYSYRAELSEVGNPAMGIPPLDRVAEVFEHRREQTVWGLINRVICNAGVPLEVDTFCAARARDRNYVLGLFLDVLPAAWGLSEADLENLLDLPGGWLRAWRNHEVQIDDELASDILELGALQVGMRLLRTPSRYVDFWHHRWAGESAIGARTPWQAFVEDGRPALDAIRRHLEAGLQ